MLRLPLPHLVQFCENTRSLTGKDSESSEDFYDLINEKLVDHLAELKRRIQFFEDPAAFIFPKKEITYVSLYKAIEIGGKELCIRIETSLEGTRVELANANVEAAIMEIEANYEEIFKEPLTQGVALQTA